MKACITYVTSHSWWRATYNQYKAYLNELILSHLYYGEIGGRETMSLERNNMNTEGDNPQGNANYRRSESIQETSTEGSLALRV